VIERAYNIGAELAYSELEKNASLFAALKAAGTAAKEGVKSWGFWGTNLGRGTKRLGWLAGLGAKQGPGAAAKLSRFSHHWIGMPTGFGLLGMALAPEGEHKGKAFAKGFAGGLAFNALMPVGTALTGGALKRVIGGNPATFGKITQGASKGQYVKQWDTLSGAQKFRRGSVFWGGMAGGLGAGMVGAHALEDSLDRPLSNLGLRNSSMPSWNPVR